jgi:hypothetical protein
MLRVTNDYGPPFQGFGLTLSADSIARTVVDAVMPAISDQIPNLVAVAWPEIQARIPQLVADIWPDIQNRVMGVIPAAVAQVEAKVPALMGQAMPILYNELPKLSSKVMPLVTKELEAQLQKYSQQYMGPLAMFKKYAPAAIIAILAITLAGASINIYRFWQGD